MLQLFAVLVRSVLSVLENLKIVEQKRCTDMMRYLISGGTTSLQIQLTHLLLSPSRCRHFSSLVKTLPLLYHPIHPSRRSLIHTPVVNALVHQRGSLLPRFRSALAFLHCHSEGEKFSPALYGSRKSSHYTKKRHLLTPTDHAQM